MKDWNKIFLRQIDRHFKGREIPKELIPFMQKINDQLEHYEQDRNMMERAMDIGQGELHNTNVKLRKETLRQQRVLDSLQESLGVLRTYQGDHDETDILLIAEKLRDALRAEKEAEKAIIVAKELAEQSVRSKELFLANMSHEIRTPMNAIIGISELLAQTGLSNEQQEYIDGIRSSGKSLLVLVNDILDFSKIEAGKFELEELGFRVDHVLQSVYSSFRINAKESGVELELDISKVKQAVLIGDPHRLSQVLINLVSNAVKFTTRGIVAISAETITQENGVIDVLFAVTDTGIGIPDDKKELIFESFTQADNSITRQYGGTGLGLAISRKLVQTMGGKLALDSTAGKGSRFYFTLSYTMGDDIDLPPPVPDHNLSTTTLKGIKVILIEDNRMNQFLVRSLMEKREIELDIANNGKEGLNMIIDNDYDLVLMDIQMPIMDGIECTRIIRNEIEREKRNIPIIALTANALKGDNEIYINAGMDDYVSKPFEASQLFGKITRLVHLSKRSKA